MKAHLYRGITVQESNADDVIENIQAKGITGDEGFWSFVVPQVKEVRENIASLFLKNDLNVDDVFKNSSCLGFCACGSENGALYYAQKHNLTMERDTPLIIEFEVEIDRIYVDGRDFLCTGFQFFDRVSKDHYTQQLEALTNLYGPHIKKYFEKSSESNEQVYRVAVSNLACFDRDTVKFHLNNSLTIYGRSNTKFQSAFFVQGPIESSAIKSVRRPSTAYSAPQPYISLNDFIEGKNLLTNS